MENVKAPPANGKAGKKEAKKAEEQTTVPFTKQDLHNLNQIFITAQEKVAANELEYEKVIMVKRQIFGKMEQFLDEPLVPAADQKGGQS